MGRACDASLSGGHGLINFVVKNVAAARLWLTAVATDELKPSAFLPFLLLVRLTDRSLLWPPPNIGRGNLPMRQSGRPEVCRPVEQVPPHVLMRADTVIDYVPAHLGGGRKAIAPGRAGLVSGSRPRELAGITITRNVLARPEGY